jgi:hypothetical protein
MNKDAQLWEFEGRLREQIAKEILECSNNYDSPFWRDVVANFAKIARGEK